MKTLVRRLAILAVAMLSLAPVPGLTPSFLAQAPTTAEAATTLYVDDDPANNYDITCPTTPYTTIQQAVNAVTASSTNIIVCTGVYYDEVQIASKTNLKLLARGDVKLIALADYDGNFIAVLSSTNVTIQGFVLDGLGHLGPAGSHAIMFSDSSGAILKNIIRNWHQPDLNLPSDYHVSIQVTNTTAQKVRIDHNTIYDFQDYGITVENPSGTKISHNLLVATSDMASIEPIAIILGKATGSSSITNNTIRTDKDVSLVSSSSQGIVLNGSSGVKVSGNNVTGAFVGITITAHCIPMSEANHNTVSSNKLYDNYIGMQVWAIGSGGCIAHADGNVITKNRLYFTGGSNINGVGITADSATTETAAGTVVKSNTFAGYGAPYMPIIQHGSGVSGTVTGPNKVIAQPPPGA